MTTKDIAQIESELGRMNSKIGKLDTGIAVLVEKSEHVLTRADLEKEVTNQIKIEQANCPNRKTSNSTTDWIKIIKIIGVIAIPIISAFTGHQIGVQ